LCGRGCLQNSGTLSWPRWLSPRLASIHFWSSPPQHIMNHDCQLLVGMLARLSVFSRASMRHRCTQARKRRGKSCKDVGCRNPWHGSYCSKTKAAIGNCHLAIEPIFRYFRPKCTRHDKLLFDIFALNAHGMANFLSILSP
jgi:hypothetical protein